MNYSIFFYIPLFYISVVLYKMGKDPHIVFLIMKNGKKK